MEFIENQNIDYKSLKLAIGAKSNLSELAESCVCFANAQGGTIIVGIENGKTEPPPDQRVSTEDLNNVISRLRSLTDGVGLANYEIIQHANGGEYFKFSILPSLRTIATTTSGKVFIRVTDKCFPVGSDELTSLAAEKNAFQWEQIRSQKLNIKDVNIEELDSFINYIRIESKVSDFIKSKSIEEILHYYQMLDGEGFLTNLGILWLGKPEQRARISYPITVQYIVYNERGEKVRKKDWHFHNFNPKDLLLDIEREAIELTYSTEIPHGLFRKQVRNYPKEVVRELLVNAFAHKKFTISGDIFIEVYPDRFVITNPGGLPLTVTKDNILHERHRRNPHFIQSLHDMSLMEGEGSGYDLIYEKLGRDAKPLPVIESSLNKMSVTVYSGILDQEVLTIMDYVGKRFALTQKEFITLGIIAREKKILPTQLSQKLQLSHEDRIRDWIGSLVAQSIVITRGIKKGTEYLLNPELFSQAKLDLKPSLKTIDPLKLEMLLEEDLKHNGASKISELCKRQPDMPREDIQKMIYKMKMDGKIIANGAKKNRAYQLAKKK